MRRIVRLHVSSKGKRVIKYYFAGYLAFIGLVIILSIFQFASAFQPELTSFGRSEVWERRWGGSEFDRGNSIVVNSSGDVYVAGITKNLGAENDTNICLLKYNRSGALVWARTWGGIGIDAGTGVAIGSNNSIYVSGTTESYGAGGSNLCLLQFNSTGHQQWYRTWGYEGFDGSDLGTSIALDSKDNVYLASSTENLSAGNLDVCLVKFNSSGEQVWNETWDSGGLDEGFSVAIDTKDDIYIAGITENKSAPGNTNICLLKFNTNGTLIWDRTVSGNGSTTAHSVDVDSYNDIYLAGYSQDFSAKRKQMCVFKFNADGNQLWNKTILNDDYSTVANSIVIDSSNVVYVGGYNESASDTWNRDAYLVKLDQYGNQLAVESFGGVGRDEICSIVLDSYQNIYFTGFSYDSDEKGSDLWAFKFGVNPPVVSIFSSAPQSLSIAFITLTVMLGIIPTVIAYNYYAQDERERELEELASAPKLEFSLDQLFEEMASANRKFDQKIERVQELITKYESNESLKPTAPNASNAPSIPRVKVKVKAKIKPKTEVSIGKDKEIWYLRKILKNPKSTYKQDFNKKLSHYLAAKYYEYYKSENVKEAYSVYYALFYQKLKRLTGNYPELYVRQSRDLFHYIDNVQTALFQRGFSLDAELLVKVLKVKMNHHFILGGFLNGRKELDHSIKVLLSIYKNIFIKIESYSLSNKGPYKAELRIV